MVVPAKVGSSLQVNAESSAAARSELTACRSSVMWMAFAIVPPAVSTGSVKRIVVAGSYLQSETPVAFLARTRYR